MQSFGVLLILLGVVLARAVFVGRVNSIPGDVADFVTALVTFDADKFSEIVLRGKSDQPSVAPTVGASSPADSATSSPVAGDAAAQLLAEVRRLGDAAIAAGGGYSQTRRNDPDLKYFDCSSLVWRGLRNIGYTSAEIGSTPFTTATFKKTMGGLIQKIDAKDRKPGDITHRLGHMAVYAGGGMQYAAKSERYKRTEQIGLQKANFDGLHSYYRLTPNHGSTRADGKPAGGDR